MNLYIRYFDKETLVYSAEEALDFLRSIPEINVDAAMEKDVRDYANSDVCFPKRYKVRPRVYFIMIKTTAQNMADFKQKKAVRPMMAPTPERREPGRQCSHASHRDLRGMVRGRARLQAGGYGSIYRQARIPRYSF